MDYTLARELKAAGFPQEGENRGPMGEFVEAGTFGTGFAYVPTLEELIFECGEQFFTLEFRNNSGLQWHAHAAKYNDYWTGTTPTEAVARLWLALHIK